MCKHKSYPYRKLHERRARHTESETNLPQESEAKANEQKAEEGTPAQDDIEHEPRPKRARAAPAGAAQEPDSSEPAPKHARQAFLERGMKYVSINQLIVHYSWFEYIHLNGVSGWIRGPNRDKFFDAYDVGGKLLSGYKMLFPTPGVSEDFRQILTNTECKYYNNVDTDYGIHEHTESSTSESINITFKVRHLCKNLAHTSENHNNVDHWKREGKCSSCNHGMAIMKT